MASLGLPCMVVHVWPPLHMLETIGGLLRLFWKWHKLYAFCLCFCLCLIWLVFLCDLPLTQFSQTLPSLVWRLFENLLQTLPYEVKGDHFKFGFLLFIFSSILPFHHCWELHSLSLILETLEELEGVCCVQDSFKVSCVTSHALYNGVICLAKLHA